MKAEESFKKNKGAAAYFAGHNGIVAGYSKKYNCLIMEVNDGQGWGDLEAGDIVFGRKSKKRRYLYIPIK